MKPWIIITALLTSQIYAATPLQEQYEKAYFLETAKGQPIFYAHSK